MQFLVELDNEDNVENGYFSSDEVVIRIKKEKKVKVVFKFGWIKGVMLRCLFNIWGVMLYFRFIWVVGQVGIGWLIVIIIFFAVVIWLITLFMFVVCINGEVKGGNFLKNVCF